VAQRIVIVDDTALNLRVLGDILSELDDVVVSAFAGGEEALAAVETLDVSLFVLDYRMPAPNGLEVLSRLRAMPSMSEVPVVMVTAADERSICYEALDLGVSDFVLRPVDPREFLRRVGNLLALEKGRRAAAEHLRRESAEARMHVRRLDVIWRAGASVALDDESYVGQLLSEASGCVTDGEATVALVGRVDGEELVVEYTATGAPETWYTPGYRYSIAAFRSVIEDGRPGGHEDMPAESADRVPFASALYAPFQCGTARYYVVFGSATKRAEEFTPFDAGFVETIASLCATRLDQRAQTDRLRYQMEHDVLTGLPNRAMLRQRSYALLRGNAIGALLVLNIDNFRHANDTLGHQTGDALLVEVGARLAAAAREGEVVARLGGDSFAIFAPQCASRVQGAHLARRLMRTFQYPFSTGDRANLERVSLQASIGVSLAPTDGTDFGQLLARADAACYTAKETGRGTFGFFDRSVEETFASIRLMQDDLGAALARNEFVLHYQPHVDIATRSIIGAEALIRWNHPTRGMIDPGCFIPFAERYGLAGAIGAWVMREAAEAARLWRKHDPSFRVWFNLSAAELRDETLAVRIRELGDVRGLGVEITESAAMENVAEAMKVMKALRKLGVRIALDDFGTGYSSLAHLKRLPLDVVKIDRAFIDGLPTDRHDAAVVNAVLSLAQSYGLETVAEGIETPEQADFLQAAGCRIGQGFLYGKGLPFNDFEALRIRGLDEEVAA
jgi:diguanylate cyclase (GGDEF)-like protein